MDGGIRGVAYAVFESSAFPKNRGIETLRRFPVGVGEQVSVSIEGCLYGRVPHLLLDILRVLVLRYHQGGAGMPQVVDPYPPELRLLQDRVEHSTGYAAVAQRHPLWCCKDQIVIVIVFPCKICSA